ncbi:MAG: GMC family oxidoreductase [Oligoflexia bacterium]|nr:GMC family oxidoreductase [Oligoflexia bacterium]
MQVLSADEARILKSLGQAVFPREAKGLPDGFDAQVADHVDALIAAALPFEQAQLRGLLQLFDRGYAAWASSPTARLVNADSSDAADYLRSWEESPVYTRRMAFEALRSICLIGYFSSDQVNQQVGVSAPPDPDAPMAFVARAVAGMTEEEAHQQSLDDPPATPPNRFIGRPTGLFEFSDYQGDLRESCDALVVGSGPGGAIVALQLARQGQRVILVEAGPVLRKQDLVRDGGLSMTRLMWDSGLRTTRGNVIAPTMQAKALGGGSVINSAICLRATDAALESWVEDHGLEDMSPAALEPHFKAVEEFMGVRPVADDVQGPRNQLFAQGCQAIGLTATPILRSEDGCLGSAGCLYGCRNGAKLSHDRRGIPEFIAAGGRVYTSVVADRLLRRGGRVAGIEGFIEEPFTGRRTATARISARYTVLATGVIATPALCQKSGLLAPAIGANLRLHPSTVVAGEFDQPVYPWTGASQGVHCLDLLDYGIKLESLWADPALMAFRMPSMGRGLKRQLARYRNMATWDAWASGDDSSGSVRYIQGVPRPTVSFQMGLGDVRRLQHATATLAEMFFAVGAKRVYPGVHGLPLVLHGPEDVAAVRSARLDHHDLPTGSNHVFSTMSMGTDPDRHACDPTGAVYGVDDLFVCDTSIFPTSPGVNPMLTMWAIAHRMGQTLAQRYA